MNEDFEGFGVFFLDGFGEGVGGIILIYLCGDFMFGVARSIGNLFIYFSSVTCFFT